MRTYQCAALVAAVWLATGCAAVPQQDKVKEVRLCSAADCEAAAHKYSAEELAAGLRHLLKANEGETVTICASEPKTRACQSVGVCYLVIGGFIPGNGCAKNIVFSEIAAPDPAGQVSLKANMPLSFIWLPAPCTTTAGLLAVRSTNEISFQFQPSLCAVMGTGVFKATFSVAVDSLDLKNGRISGYWSHASAGTGNGRGSGYAVLQFPKAMPEGENWLVEAARPVRAQLSGTQPANASMPVGSVQSTPSN
jgi:hypothetical protein